MLTHVASFLLFFSKGLHVLCHITTHAHTVYTATFTQMPPLFTVAPLTHYLTSHAAAPKRGAVSTNEAWDHFTDGWLIPQMHQPDQSPIYCLLISALRAALLSSRKIQIYYKDLGHDNCWYLVWVCVHVCARVPIWLRRRFLADREPLLYYLCIQSICEFPQLECNYLLMFNKVRHCKDQIYPPLFLKGLMWLISTPSFDAFICRQTAGEL